MTHNSLSVAIHDSNPLSDTVSEPNALSVRILEFNCDTLSVTEPHAHQTPSMTTSPTITPSAIYQCNVKRVGYAQHESNAIVNSKSVKHSVNDVVTGVLAHSYAKCRQYAFAHVNEIVNSNEVEFAISHA